MALTRLLAAAACLLAASGVVDSDVSAQEIPTPSYRCRATSLNIHDLAVENVLDILRSAMREAEWPLIQPGFIPFSVPSFGIRTELPVGQATYAVLLAWGTDRPPKVVGAATHRALLDVLSRLSQEGPRRHQGQVFKYSDAAVSIALYVYERDAWRKLTTQEARKMLHGKGRLQC